MSRHHKGTRPRNPSPPNFSSKGHTCHNDPTPPSRKIRNVISGADHEELRKHYTFLPSDDKSNKTWQDRMVNHYHSHLYKEYVLADMSRAPLQLGLRWRTQEEVQNGRGHATCGNKHCPGGGQMSESIVTQPLLSKYYQSYQPSNNEQEQALLERLPHGIGLHDYEVPFTYTEKNQTKTELVKLRLCLRCSPLLFKGGAIEARRARRKQNGPNSEDEESPAQEKQDHLGDIDESPKQRKRPYSDNSSSDDQRERHRRRSKHKKRKKKHRT